MLNQPTGSRRHAVSTFKQLIPPRPALIVASLAISWGATAQNLDFSLTPGSPLVPSTYSPADDIEAGGTILRIPSSDLGLQTADNVTGLSYGQAEAADINVPYFIKRIAYSVDTASTGTGAPITPEVTIDGAAGDTFALDFVGLGIQRFVIRRPFTVLKAQTRNLTVKSDPADPEDDIDALALYRESKYPVYVTFPAGSGYDPASIYIITAQGSPPQVFANATDLNLVTGDVIDAFALGTIPFGGVPPTTLNANVVIWISLDRSSPSRGAVGDSILQAWPTPRGTVLGWPQLGLTINDEINALAVLDPAPAVAATTIDNTATVFWSGTGLESAPSADGPFTVVSSPENPYEPALEGEQLYFRSFAPAPPPTDPAPAPTLEKVESPTEENLYAVWGSAPNDIYAVGDAGVVVHYDGESWSLETETPPTSNRLSTIYSAGPDELYFGGADGLFRRGAQGWSENMGPEGVTGVTGVTKTPSGELHLVAGRVWWRLDGNTWYTNAVSYAPYISLQLQANRALTDVTHIIDPLGNTGLIATGEDGLFPNQRNLSLSSGGAGASTTCVWALSPDTVMVGSRESGVFRYAQKTASFNLRSAQNWKRMIGPGADIEGVHGNSPQDVYAVGNSNTIPPGRIFRFNGNESDEWSVEQSVPDELYAVWVSGDLVVAVGQGIYMDGHKVVVATTDPLGDP